MRVRAVQIKGKWTALAQRDNLRGLSFSLVDSLLVPSVLDRSTRRVVDAKDGDVTLCFYLMVGAANAVGGTHTLAPVKGFLNCISYVNISGGNPALANREIRPLSSDSLRQAEVRARNHSLYLIMRQFNRIKIASKRKAMMKSST